MEVFMKTLLSLSAAGSLLGLIVLLLSKAGKKHLSSSFVYLCWALVILRFALPLQGLIGLNLYDQPAAQNVPAATESAKVSYYVSPLSRSEGALTRETANKNAQIAADSNAVDTQFIAESGTAAANTASDAPAKAAPLYLDWRFWFYVWLGGAVISFGGTLISFKRFRRILFRTLKPANPLDSSVLSALNASPYPALYRSDKVSSSLLLGLLRPVIVLPDREYSSEDLDRILRHELTHYRRGDLALKWLQTLVFSAHWFNPLVYLFRSQTTLYCELSCDQTLIKRMDRDDKQSYGEMLLNLAADRALPRCVIAVSFTTQKRDLKERLVQIMSFKKLGKQAMALGLAALMMIAGCAFVLGPARASSASDNGSAAAAANEYETIRVSDVDQFIDALGSNRTILLASGNYDLSKAKTYGRTAGSSCYWEEVDDGYTLVLDVLSNLTIAGEDGSENVSIVTRPRCAAVIKLLGCSDVNLQGVTCGHIVLPDSCMGAVLDLYGCRNVQIDGCVLYGCGTMGIYANECWKIKTTNTVIKECSICAIEVANSYDIVFDGCEFHDCEAHDGYSALSLIEAYNTTVLGVYNTAMYSNHVDTFVRSSNCHGVELAGCRVNDNRFYAGFEVYGDNVAVAACEFGPNGLNASGWFTGEYRDVRGLDGERIDANALLNMQWAEYPAEERAVTEPQRPEGKLLADGTTEYHVSSVDEMLNCIGSDTVIYLEGDHFELSAAAEYGGQNRKNYYWMECWDGYGLVLIGINNMKIVVPEGKANVELMPRSADVLAFKYCSNITLENLILGHIKGAGSCTGDVVSFMGCDSCELNNCELYGCGVNGVNAFASVDIHVNHSEIYECSLFAAVVSDCSGTEFNDVVIRDCGYNSIQTQRSRVLFSGSTYYSDDYVPNYGYDDYYDYGEETDLEPSPDIAPVDEDAL